MKSAFDRIMAGIEDVTAYAKGDGSRVTRPRFRKTPPDRGRPRSIQNCPKDQAH